MARHISFHIAGFVWQVHVYSSPVDVHVWSGQTASVLIISYDMFSRLKTQVDKAAAPGTGDAPTQKVCFTPRSFTSNPPRASLSCNWLETHPQPCSTLLHS